MAESEKTEETPDIGSAPQPGAVVSPGASSSPPAGPDPAPPETSPVLAKPKRAKKPKPVAEAPESEEPAPEPETTPDEPDDQNDQDDQDEGDQVDQSIKWTASEFVAHEKSIGWYAGLVVATLLGSALMYLVTKEKIAVAVAVTAGLFMGIYGSHQPRQLDYKIDKRGVGIGAKYHVYDEFRSFSIVPEGAFSSIVFMPLRRFAVPTTVYFPPADQDKIVSILSDQLPFEERRGDAVDRLMRRIRF